MDTTVLDQMYKGQHCKVEPGQGRKRIKFYAADDPTLHVFFRLVAGIIKYEVGQVPELIHCRTSNINENFFL